MAGHKIAWPGPTIDSPLHDDPVPPASILFI